jgi:predicted dehydrogenase
MSKIRLAMVGGGQGAFIGAVHRTAAWIDGQAEFVAGSFSSNLEKCQQTGQDLFLNPDRVYATYSEMMEAESSYPEDQRIDAVSIVTPNHLHAAPALEAMSKGFHVIVDKPMAFSVDEAIEMEKAAREHNVLLAVTHTYSGYPMIKEMKHRVANGDLGTIRKVYVEYPQGWLSTGLDLEGQKQASWRTDPSKSGAGGAVGDIGTHAAHLAEYVASSSITHVAAELGIHIEGRRLDDDAAALLRFGNGATGVLMATQVAAGEENTLKLRIYGEKGGFEWSHADPNSLLYKPLDAPLQILRTGNGYLCEAAANASRIPPGHPEGYLEAFANLYLEFFQAIRDHKAGTSMKYDFPDGVDGVHGLQFIDAMIRSSQSEQKWTKVERYSP